MSKSFSGSHGTLVALDGIDLDVARGSFVALLGPSGCGKSTLLRMLAGLDEPTTGTVELGGESPRTVAKRGEIGIAFQSPALLPWRTARQNVALPLETDRRRKRDGAAEVDRLLDLVGLGDFGDALPGALSGGMQQRVAIARALVGDPSLLLLDEPFAALDEITRLRLNLELQRIWTETAPTTILVTHSVTEAVLLADSVVVMGARPGRIIERVQVGLEWPRTVETTSTSEFHSMCDRLRGLLLEGTSD